MARYTSSPGLFGQTNYYDESGTRVGESWPGMIEGSENFYGNDGNFLGSSALGIASDQVFRDEHGDRLGSSMYTVYGRAFFDTDGELSGTSVETMTGEAFDFF